MRWLWYIVGRWAQERGDRLNRKVMGLRKVQEKFFRRCGLDRYGNPPGGAS